MNKADLASERYYYKTTNGNDYISLTTTEADSEKYPVDNTKKYVKILGSFAEWEG